MYDSHILTEHDCRNMWEHGKKYGYGVDITINYYRGLPLSCVEEIALEVDGEPIDPADMILRISGKEFLTPTFSRMISRPISTGPLENICALSF